MSKSAGIDELVVAIEPVAKGGRYVDPEIAGEIAVTQYASDGEDPLRGLSTREVEMLRLLGESNSLWDVAQTLGVAYKTVANTCSRIESKLGVERTGDLIRLSMQLKRR